MKIRKFTNKAVIMALLVLTASSASARKEYRTLRAQLKASQGDAALASVAACMKDARLAADPELSHYGVEAWLKVNEALNRQAYLGQKYDTAKLFNSVSGIYEYALRCDSLETVANAQRGKKKPRWRWRESHGSLMRRLYPNLFSGGQYWLLKKNFSAAYSCFSTYNDVRPTPLFSGGPLRKADSLRLCRSAYWATVCAFQLKDSAKFRRYSPMALLDTAFRPRELELVARLAVTLGDTARYVRALQCGAAEYPAAEYFTSRLLDYYNSRGQYDASLRLADSLLARDPRSLLAQYAKSLVCLRTGRYSACIALARSIIESDSTYAEAYYNAGAAYYAQAVELQGQTRAGGATLAEARRARQSVEKLMRQSLPYLETYRRLKPDAVEWWGRPLYAIYLALNMGPQFEEIDKVLSSQAAATAANANNAPAAANANNAQANTAAKAAQAAQGNGKKGKGKKKK